MIPGAAALAAVLAAVWAWHHPLPAAALALAAVLLVIGVVRFCREIAPSLSVGSWPPSPVRPWRPSPSWSPA